MASINKLSIRGIRSFSHEREQVIEFYSPLTMIVGANGCGKTTVIECLKYACTGALPPGARNGHSFVHDPKVSGTNEVKANIKLRFAGRDGRVSVVVRSLQLTQKRVSLEFKALDGVIRTKNDDGVSVSINHKCTEMDKHIPLRMGVSKAILENVVFCHQEDASWPLQEGAVVKTKFDDIFESARYTKALDTIKKTKQEYAVAVKDLKIDLAGLQERLRAAEDLQGELEASREMYGGLREEIEAIDARTKELSESLTELHAVADQVDLLEGKKRSLELTCRDLTVRMAEKKENIGDALSTDSDEVLDKNLMEFDARLDACADEINFFKNESEKCFMRARNAKREKDTLQGEQGNVQAQLSHQERVVAEHDSMIERLSERHGIFNPVPPVGPSGAEPSGSVRRYTSEDIATFEDALRGAHDKAQAALNETRASTRLEDESMNAQMNTLKLEQRSSLAAVHAKERELLKIQGEAMSLAQGGGSVGMGSQSQLGTATVSKLERELKAAEKAKKQAVKEFEDFFKGDKTQEIVRKVKTLETRLGEIRAAMEEEEASVRALSVQQDEQSQISVKTAQIADDESRLEERVGESPAFNKFVRSPPQVVTQAALGSACTEIRMAADKAEGDRADKATQVMNLHREVAQNNTNLVNARRERSRVVSKIASLSGAVDVVRAELAAVGAKPDKTMPDPEKDFDHILEKLKEQDSKAKKRLSVLGWSTRFSNLILQEAIEKHHCPTCRRGLDDEELQEFTAHQRTVAEEGMLPNAEEIKAKQVASEASLSRVQAVAQQWWEWSRLSLRPEELAEEVSKLEEEGAAKREELEKEEREEKALRNSRNELNAALQEAEKCCEEAARIEAVRFEVERIRQRLQRYSQNTGSLSDAQERVRELTAEKDKVVNDIQAKGKELTALGNKKYSVTTSRTMREADFDKAEGDLKAKKEFDRKREMLREREKALESELKELKSREQPLRQQVAEKTAQHTRVRDQATAAVERLYAAAQECRADMTSFSQSQKRVVAGEAKKLPEALASIQAKLKDAEEMVVENEKSARENERIMTGKVLQSDKQVHLKKVLRDNIEYRSHARELAEREKEVTAVEAEIAETNSQDVRGKISSLNGETQKKTQKRAELKGRLHGLKDQIRGFEHKLATDTYRNIEQKHRRKMIEHRTTEMAVSDLDKYWTALDKALLRFHTMKIADINKIIRELWAMTYSGEDIDMIEIVSGDQPGAGKAKRSYNYRVAMRKNDATLDMKGRCSAGQRVLASVVIRLALAETFCVSCGILALDEPTTNLDHNNKVGLAHALAKIISSRSKQSNFQLVTITHDEEFVQTMRTELGTQGGFSMPEFYWRISREEMSRGKFYSRIDRLDWEDM